MRMSTRVKKLSIAALGTAVLAGAWLLFGWRTEPWQNGTIRYYREFGAYTRLAYDVQRDGRWDYIAHFSRDQPADEGHSAPYRTAEDRDNDGNFDTWMETQQGSTETILWKVDLEHDEIPDWEFVEADSLAAYSAIKKRRGY